MDYPLEGKIGVVAGWGKTDNSFGKTGTNLLNKVRPILIDKQLTEPIDVTFWR